MSGTSKDVRPSLIGGLLALCLVHCAGDGAFAQPQPRFCVVPVKDGTPTEADHRQTWRIVTEVFQIPGLPSPVFTPANRKGQWTIGADRALVPYSGLYPRGYLDRDKWVFEPWSGRIIALTWGGGVSSLSPGGSGFERIDDEIAGRGPNRIWRLVVLPRRQATVAVSSTGKLFTVKDRSLDSHHPTGKLNEIPARITSLHDSPLLAATIVLDRDGGLHVLTDNDVLHRVASLSKDEYGRLHDMPGSEAAVFVAQKSVLAIRKSGEKFSAETLHTTRNNQAFRAVHFSKQFGQLLAYRSNAWLSDQPVWQRLGPRGFEDIPGGNIGVARPDLFPRGQIQDLPTLGKVLIQGGDRLYVYDGASIHPVQESERNRIGDLPRIYDLPSIQRVIVSTSKGLFELTQDNQLIARPMPLTLEGLPAPQLLDWPQAGVALISTKDGLSAFDADLNVLQIANGERVRLGWHQLSVGFVGTTGEPILFDSSGLFMAIDSNRAGPEVCRQAHGPAQ